VSVRAGEAREVWASSLACAAGMVVEALDATGSRMLEVTICIHRSKTRHSKGLLLLRAAPRRRIPHIHSNLHPSKHRRAYLRGRQGKLLEKVKPLQTLHLQQRLRRHQA
jgi:hypothetical protein